MVEIEQEDVLEFLEKRKNILEGVCITGGEPFVREDLEEIIEITTELGLLGVNVAHSGSIVGILLTQDQLIHLNKLEERLSQHPLASYYSIRNLSKIIYDGLKVKKVEEICG